MEPLSSPAVSSIVLMAHAVSTLAMVGLIWFVQIVHYPLFGRVGAESFAAYEREHQSRTGLVVAPLMLTELATSIALPLVVSAPQIPIAIAGLSLTVFLWIWTFAIMVPQHRRLAADGGAESAIRRLVRTNWPRTWAWSARGGVALAVVLG